MNGTWWLGQEQLKHEQLEVMQLAPDDSFLLLGPPGSGKTNLLLLRANYLWLFDYPNIAVVVFTKTLQRFIESGAAQYDFPSDKIVTSRKWQINLLRLYGVRPPTFRPGDTFEAQRATLNELIRNELLERRQLKNVFDAIFVDEAHDYTPSEIDTFRTLAKVLVLSADSRQKIYSTPDAMKALEEATDTTITLKHHYRIGRKICIVADAIGKSMSAHAPMLDNCQYEEAAYPSSVTAVRSSSAADAAAAAVKELGLQLDAYPNDIIGVIAPTNAIVDEVWAAISQSPYAAVAVRHSTDDHPALEPGTRIVVSTIHSAKGLEFRAVHIAGADRLQSSPQGINLAFTAVTRAKTSVHLHFVGGLPGFLEKAVRQVEAPRPLPDLATLFGKKGAK